MKNHALALSDSLYHVASRGALPVLQALLTKLAVFISDSFFLFLFKKSLCQLNKPHARVCADYFCGEYVNALTMSK